MQRKTEGRPASRIMGRAGGQENNARLVNYALTQDASFYATRLTGHFSCNTIRTTNAPGHQVLKTQRREDSHSRSRSDGVMTVIICICRTEV